MARACTTMYSMKKDASGDQALFGGSCGRIWCYSTELAVGAMDLHVWRLNDEKLHYIAIVNRSTVKLINLKLFHLKKGIECELL